MCADASMQPVSRRRRGGSRPGTRTTRSISSTHEGREAPMADSMASSIVIRRRHRRSAGFTRFCILFLLLGVLGAISSGRAWADGPVPFSPGDLVIGIGSSPDGSSQGKLLHFSPSGVLLDTLLTTSGSFEETGACFDADKNLYTTNFEANSMSKFGPTGSLSQASFGSGFNEHPNSCIVDGTGSHLRRPGGQGRRFRGRRRTEAERGGRRDGQLQRGPGFPGRRLDRSGRRSVHALLHLGGSVHQALRRLHERPAPRLLHGVRRRRRRGHGRRRSSGSAS